MTRSPRRDAALGRRVLIYLGVATAAAVAAVTAVTRGRPAPVAGQAPRPTLAARPPQAPPPLRPPSQPSVEVASVRGPVERSATGGGGWEAVNAGARLSVDDSLRTGEGAAVELRVDERARIEVAERSEMTVREVTRSVHRFRLTQGRLSAKYGADGSRVLRVEGADGEVVETREGQVGVLETGDSFAVAAQSGSATLRAAGRTVEVGTGLQAVAQHASAPGAATPIPVEVWLRLANPDRPLPGDRTALVRGTTSPGARVKVNGHVAEVDGAGSFRVVIPVRVGRNRVVAVVEDALGRTARRTLPPIVIEPKGDIDDVSIRWGRTDAPL